MILSPRQRAALLVVRDQGRTFSDSVVLRQAVGAQATMTAGALCRLGLLGVDYEDRSRRPFYFLTPAGRTALEPS